MMSAVRDLINLSAAIAAVTAVLAGAWKLAVFLFESALLLIL